MKVAIVTGAAQGIGRRTAEVLAREGYALALLDLKPCDATIAEARVLGAEAHEFLGDVSDESCVTKTVAGVLAKWGRVDLLVNNAGISFIAPAETTDGQAFLRVLAVNLLGPFLLSKGFGKVMLAQKSGSIVNVASIAGLVGIADRAAYNASKHGLIGLTRTLFSRVGRTRGAGKCRLSWLGED